MATFHRLTLFSVGGSGAITSNPDNSLGIFEAGEIIQISIVPDPGFTFQGWYIGSQLISNNLSFSFTMPSSDVFLFSQFVGVYTPVGTFGLRYFYEWDRPRTGRHRLEIEQLDYAGAAEEASIQEIEFSMGESGSDQSDTIKTIVHGSRINFTVPAIQSRALYYTDLLDYNPFKFRVKYYQGYNAATPSASDWKWTGYLMTEFYEQEENDLDYPVTFTASDGLNGATAYRIKTERLLGFTGIKLLASFLRQNWIQPLPIATCVEVHETRMNRTQGVFEQFSLNNTRFIEKNEALTYDENGFQFNPYINLKQAIEYTLSPWFCRIFQWNQEWQVIRIPELLKANLQFHKYDGLGDIQSSPIVANSQPVQNLYNAIRRGALAFNEFEVLLELGNTAVPELNQLVKEDFENESWFNYGGARYYLVNWEFINATWMDGERGSDIARIEWVRNPSSGESGVFARIWGTANGLADPNLSGFVYKSQDRDRPGVAKEAANKISLSAKYQILRRGSNDPRNPPPGSHKVVFALKIGNQWLQQVSETTFSFTTTPTKIALDPKPYGVFHTIKIEGIEVPEDGNVELYFYQLVTITGTRHRYVIDWDEINLNLEQNQDIINSDLVIAAETLEEFGNKASPYTSQIGDAFTNVSASAIRLNQTGDPVSELWTRDGVEEPKILLEIIIREFVNILGKPVLRLVGILKANRPDPTKAFDYDGKKWLISSISYTDTDDFWTVELINLD